MTRISRVVSSPEFMKVDYISRLREHREVDFYGHRIIMITV